MYDIICVGQAVLDCITRGRETSPYKPNVYRAQTIRLHTGGDAVNESMALAGMGFRTAIVCALGSDIAGDCILGALTRAGVATQRIRRCAAETPIANLQVADDGSRISVNSDATRLEGFRLDPADVKGARVVSLASLFRPPLEDIGVIKEVIRAAAESGAVVCADTKLPLRGDIRLGALADVLPMIDYFFPNEREAAYYAGDGTLPEMAARLTDMGIKRVIIKAGPAGCHVRGDGEDFALPAVPVENVVDTTGAGDNFVAGFISGILANSSLRECASAALNKAAEAITHTGGAVD